MIDRITPVLLTFNEAANIERTLAGLEWAKRIVVVDSGSEDETMSLARKLRTVDAHTRPFDLHARQWSFAVHETGIDTEWILALDADYLVPADLVREIEDLDPADDVAGYQAAFVYCVHGHPLHGSLYPPVTVLFRRARARFEQDGHTQRVIVDGRVESLASRIRHDDRKSLDAWLQSQSRYMRLEAALIAASSWNSLGWADRARKTRVLAPLLIPLYCLFAKGCWRDGRAGWHYVAQRTAAELILLLHLLERDFAADFS